MDGLIAILIGFTTYYMSLLFGNHLGDLIIYFLNLDQNSIIENENEKKKPKILDYLIFLFSVGLWIMFAFLYIYVPSSRLWSFSAFLSPIGANIRWILSLYNINWPRFKLYTFLVNIIGTIIYAILAIFSQRTNIEFEIVSLQGGYNGFCGSLTTVSTFLNEIKTITTEWSYKYALTSILIAQFFILFINGLNKL